MKENQAHSSISTVSEQKKLKELPIRIDTDLLIPGRGQPSKNVTVIIKDGKIKYAGSTSSLPSKYAELENVKVRVLMPGLWDCHLHLSGLQSLKLASVVSTSHILAGARITKTLNDILMSGFTSVRDLGGYACEIAPAVEDGTIPGPNIYSAGAAISQTAGHGDIFDLPIDVVMSRLCVAETTKNSISGESMLCIADGIDEVRRAVRLQIRRGAKVIKIFASGGVLSIGDDPKLQQFSDAEMKTIVEEANRHGRVVAAHAHGKPGIMAAIRAGVHTIEHGTYLDEECVTLMKEKDMVYVPTRTIVRVGVDNPNMMDPESYVKMVETAKHHLDAYKLALKHGVKIATGTDLVMSGPLENPLSLGKSGVELVYAVKDAGMTPLQAIEAATANGPAVLGDLGMAPKSGLIEIGFDADLVALSANPIDDIELLANPKNVTHVWKGGKLFKSP